MEKYTGKAIFQRVAIGKIWYYARESQDVKRHRVVDAAGELKRYEDAKVRAAAELAELYQKALEEAGEETAAILEIHTMMLEDEDYNDSVRMLLENQQVNAEYAVAATGEEFARMFSEMDDPYFQARSADVKDVSERLVSILSGRKRADLPRQEPVIVAAKDLAPSETVQMEKEKLLGFVTEGGSSNSHTAILARTMGIPAIIGIPVEESWDGRLCIVDGYTGTVYLDPEEDVLVQMRAKQKADQEKARLLRQMRGKETVTGDGRSLHLYANIGSLEDIPGVLENDGEGIGLFRSEFLYLGRENFPAEEEQFQTYKAAAEQMAGRKVIIRTLDIGADKQASYFHLDREENPAMGFRAIRICLERPEIFKTQLRALYRASMYGDLAVMYPMITSVEEVRRIKEIAEEVKGELRSEGIPFREMEQGIMIETPAAALISDMLAKEVDFFSIGTNDLSQYTMAIDRQNPALDGFFQPHHPALLRLIQMTVDNGHREGCWVGICGELGADLELTGTFVDMGIDELSVAPGRILEVRAAVRSIAQQIRK